MKKYMLILLSAFAVADARICFAESEMFKYSTTIEKEMLKGVQKNRYKNGRKKALKDGLKNGLKDGLKNGEKKQFPC